MQRGIAFFSRMCYDSFVTKSERWPIKLIVELVIGGLCGFAANRIMHGKSDGILLNVILGLVGGVVGGAIGNLIGVGGGWVTGILLSIGGTATTTILNRIGPVLLSIQSITMMTPRP